MVLSIFSDGSFRHDPVRVYFVFYDDGEPNGPYVFPTIDGAVETAREHLALGHRVRLELQRKPMGQGGEQVVIWDSPPPVRTPRYRLVR